MDKFGRNYELKVGTKSGAIVTITLPFTVEFDITRNTLTSANVCQIRIFNLSEQNRNLMRFNISDYGHYRPIVLRAGYGNKLAKIFTGNISAAWSVREGVNFITQIECYDGGFAFVNGDTKIQFSAGTPNSAVLAEIASKGLPNVKIGAIGDYPGVLSRGNMFSGNTIEILKELTGGGAFVDQGKFNALSTSEYIESSGSVFTIDSKSGLLATPVLEQTIVRFDMVFEPALNVGHIVQLKSSTEKNFNGLYKVTAVKHRGMISAAVCGTAVTTGEFFYNKILTGVKGAAQ